MFQVYLKKKIKKASAVASEPQRNLQAFKIHQSICMLSLLQELEISAFYLFAFRPSEIGSVSVQDVSQDLLTVR